MNFRMILRIQSQALLTFAVAALLPIAYELIHFKALDTSIFFVAAGIFAILTGIIFQRFGTGRFQRAPVTESAAAILMMYPMLAIFGCLPFMLTGWLSPLDAILEAVGDLTSAGLSLLPLEAPYLLKLWQSELMWLGSLMFLIMLVTVLPEVSGCFGISLSLQGGQNFSAIIGQMNLMSVRVIKVYVTLTLIGIAAFKLAGLNIWDSLLMAMRCISTGGGDFLPEYIAPEYENFYVEYAAIFVMLLACGNFLLYYRVIYTLIPPRLEFGFNYFTRLKQYFLRLRRTISGNAKLIFANEEVKVLYATVFFSMIILMFRAFTQDIYFDGNETFRSSLFHIVSFVSTTGITFVEDTADVHDFDKFFVFLMAVTGGCIGSVTGGFKIIRLIVLIKITAAEIKKTIHPRMMTAIHVGDVPVPMRTVGRILSFFFLALVTMFICAGLLSFTGKTFSESVAMSIACLSTVGKFPGLCDAESFRSLTALGKIFCMMILIVGRLEIFALLIAVAGIKIRRRKSDW
ncbi:MAG: TrkH family potassium uptake protein [Selenomonadaceae bacterium]|nr:TrkH family potassium uptake protein [Selenomonadaceae bacterium]